MTRFLTHLHLMAVAVSLSPLVLGNCSTGTAAPPVRSKADSGVATATGGSGGGGGTAGTTGGAGGTETGGSGGQGGGTAGTTGGGAAGTVGGSSGGALGGSGGSTTTTSQPDPDASVREDAESRKDTASLPDVYVPGPLDIATIIGDLDGLFFTPGCRSTGASANECPTTNVDGTCPSRNDADWFKRGAHVTKTINVKGDPNTTYKVTIQLRGIVGGKIYSNTVRQSTAPLSRGEANDAWCAGGQPAQTTYNTYSFAVDPPVTGEPPIYWINCFAESSGAEAHMTYFVKTTASFKVKGGSKVTIEMHDPNCTAMMNCGTSPSNECPAPRTIDLTGMTPSKTTFTQPYMENGKQYPQWILFDVTAVEAL